MFVDSSAFFAVIDRDDRDNARADAIQNSLFRSSARLVTSNFIVAECHALILNRVGRDPALLFLNRMEANGFEVVRVTPEDEARAVQIIRQYDDKSFSYVDGSSFAVMERLDINLAFSFDRHFAQYGFQLIDEDAL